MIKDFKMTEIPEKTKSIIKFVEKLTRSPSDMKKDELKDLKDNGFNDKDILDITLIASYFNFVNRIALGLGVEFSIDEVKGYRY